MMKNIRITVFTPVYNRRHTIHRVFDSLMQQTVKDFEWLIVDDGSTDNIKPLIDEYIEKADFPVRYYYKENGGKHTATNLAYTLTNTEYFTILDSDDAFLCDAIEKMLKAWDSVPSNEKDRYWAVVGHCVDSKTGEIVGELFPDGINSFDDDRRREAVKGEKISAQRTEIVKKYPFPEPKGTNFITESIVYNKIERDYRQYYVNDFFRVYYTDEPDSLTVAWYRDHVEEGYVSNFVWKQSIINDVGIKHLKDYFILFQYTFYGVMCKKTFSEITSGIGNGFYRAICALLFVPAKVFRTLRSMKK